MRGCQPLYYCQKNKEAEAWRKRVMEFAWYAVKFAKNITNLMVKKDRKTMKILLWNGKVWLFLFHILYHVSAYFILFLKIISLIFFFENIFCLGSKITNFDWFYVAFSLIRKNEMKIRRFCLFVDVEIVMIIDIDMINDN